MSDLVLFMSKDHRLIFLKLFLKLEIALKHVKDLRARAEKSLAPQKEFECVLDRALKIPSEDSIVEVCTEALLCEKLLQCLLCHDMVGLQLLI